MEHQQRTDDVARRRSDVSTELRRRAQAAKPAALKIRQALQGYPADGATLTVLDHELARLRLEPEVAAVARRALWHPDNNAVVSAGYQTVDPVVMLTAKQNLPPGWDPGGADVALVVRDLVSEGCAYAGLVRRMGDDFLAKPPAQTRRFRVAVWPNAQSELETALMAELLCGTVDPVHADPDLLDRVLRDAQERLICRFVVADAVHAIMVDASDPEADAWMAARKVAMAAYGMVEELADGPAPAGQVRQAGRLERLARRWAGQVGRVDEGLLLAILKVTLRSYGLKLIDAETARKRRWRRENPLSGLPDAERQSANSELDDRAPGTTSFEPLIDEKLDGDGPKLVHALFVEMTADDAGAPPDERPAGAALSGDIVRLLWLCHVVVPGDAIGWLAKCYPPKSHPTPMRPRTIWSLCQAVRPHHVLWPGYPDGPSERVRGFVSQARADLRDRVLETDAGALLAVRSEEAGDEP